jgi:anti-anti-sigma factor
VTQAAVVDLVGGLDLGSVARWEAEVGKAASTSGTVVLDLTGVDFLDSAGVHGLFRILAALDGQGKRFVVVAPRHGRARRLLEILDLQSLVRLCESRAEATIDDTR